MEAIRSVTLARFHSRVFDSELFEIVVVFRRIVIAGFHLRPVLFHGFLIQQMAGLSPGAEEALIFHVLGLDVLEVIPGLLTNSGCSRISSMVMAWTFAPATTPLCAMGVAIEIAVGPVVAGATGNVRGIAQRDGRDDPGDVADIVGSAARRLGRAAASHRPLLRLGARGAAECTESLLARPRTGAFNSRCRALASVWSASDHCGRPTFLMFAYMSSAIGLLKWPGQALPSKRRCIGGIGHESGACAMLSPICHRSMMWS